MKASRFCWHKFGLLAALVAIPSVSLKAADSSSDLPKVRVTATDPVALEGVSSGAFTILLKNRLSSDLSVNFTVSGTASNGVDYVLLTNQVTIPSGALATNLVVQPISDPQYARTEKVTLTLITNAAYRIESPKSASVVILDPELEDLVPAVSITSPSTGATFPASTNIVINADATDSDGSIAKVTFYANDRTLGMVTAPPYSLTWSNVSAGHYSLFARAEDNVGKSKLSEPVEIKVNPIRSSIPVAQIALTSPTNGAVFKVPANITLVAEATSTNSSVQGVQFYGDNRFLGTVTNQPFSLVWSNVPPGEHSIAVRATGGSGPSVTAKPVRIVVTDAAPTIALTEPINNTAFTAGGNVTISANASDSDDTVKKVNFYANERLIGSASAAPYSMVWSNVPAGTFKISAYATDSYGKSSSASATIKVSRR